MKSWDIKSRLRSGLQCGIHNKELTMHIGIYIYEQAEVSRQRDIAGR